MEFSFSSVGFPQFTRYTDLPFGGGPVSLFSTSPLSVPAATLPHIGLGLTWASCPFLFPLSSPFVACHHPRRWAFWLISGPSCPPLPRLPLPWWTAITICLALCCPQPGYVRPWAALISLLRRARWPTSPTVGPETAALQPHQHPFTPRGIPFSGSPHGIRKNVDK